MPLSVNLLLAHDAYRTARKAYLEYTKGGVYDREGEEYKRLWATYRAAADAYIFLQKANKTPGT